MVEATGTGLTARADVVATSEVQLSTTVAQNLRELCHAERGSLFSLAAFPAQLVPSQCEVIDALVAEAHIPREDVIAVGVDDPGIWDVDGDHRCYLGLCDAARLAEASGLNVIDAFAARDVGSGGLGGRLTPATEWLLLADQRKPVIILHIDDDMHATLIPPKISGGDLSTGLASFEIGPGMRLLDKIDAQIRSICGYQTTRSVLVAGENGNSGLLATWLRNDLLAGSQPRWQPRGLSVKSFLTESATLLQAESNSGPDVLRTTYQFIAAATVRTIGERVPKDCTLGKVILAGRGQDDSPLVQELQVRLPDVPFTTTVELGLLGADLDAACTALLALLHIDQVPATQTSTTRISIPRVLGRLTPGAAQNWHRLLNQASEAKPQVMSLRAAL